MGDSLREYFAAIGSDDLATHGLESMALCAAIHMASQRAGASKNNDVRGLLADWVKTGRHDAPAADMRRMQPLLEELLAEVENGRLSMLTPDEGTLLFAVSALLKMLPATEYYESVRARLEPHQDALGKFVGGNPPKPSLDSISDRWVLLCSHDLDISPRRELKKIAGIPIEFQGKVCTVPMRTKLIGSLPERTMLVVENGVCCIEGFVEGIAVTRGDCIVQENVSGVIISSEGDVQARKLIDRSRVIAKWGSVQCSEAAAPELAFAGRRIAVERDATRGDYRAHEVVIGGRAMGCKIAVSSHARAARFVHSDRFETAVILRREFDAADYGEEIDVEARRMLSRAGRIKQRLRTVQELTNALTTEVEQDAHTTLVYFAVGDDGMSRIEVLETAQRRLATLNRVIMGLHQLNSEVEENAYAVAWESQGDAVAETEDEDSLAEIFDELESLDPGRGEDQSALDPAVGQLKEMHSHVGETRANRLAVVSLLDESRSRLRSWLDERDVLRARIQQVHQEMEGAVNVFPATNEFGRTLSSIERLRNALGDERLLARSREFQMRANSRFVRLMRNNINLRLDRLRELKLESKRLRTEFETIQQELMQKVRLRADQSENSEPPPVTVTGRFDAGVRLCTTEVALEAETVTDTVLLTISAPREEVTTFRRSDTGIVEVE